MNSFEYTYFYNYNQGIFSSRGKCNRDPPFRGSWGIPFVITASAVTPAPYELVRFSAKVSPSISLSADVVRP